MSYMNRLLLLRELLCAINSGHRILTNPIKPKCVYNCFAALLLRLVDACRPKEAAARAQHSHSRENLKIHVAYASRPAAESCIEDNGSPWMTGSIIGWDPGPVTNVSILADLMQRCADAQ